MASAGRILIMPKGAYNSSTTYEMLDMVSYNGTTWIAKKTVKGIAPSDANSEYWQNMFNFNLGGSDISTIGDGTVKGAIKHLSENKLDVMAKYYAAETLKNVDDVLDNLALVPISTTVNPELYAIMSGTFAWVITLFYNEKETNARRVQIALSYNAVPTKMAIRSYGPDGFDDWQKVDTGNLSAQEEIPCDTLVDKVKMMRSGRTCQVYFGATVSEISANTITTIVELPENYRPSSLRDGMVAIGLQNATLPLYVVVNSLGQLSIRARETLPSGMSLYGVFTYIL